MPVLSWIFSPFARVAGAVVAVITAVAAIYWKGRGEGAAALRAKQQEETNRRLSNAMDADAHTRGELARGRLLDDDGHRRD